MATECMDGFLTAYHSASLLIYFGPFHWHAPDVLDDTPPIIPPDDSNSIPTPRAQA